MVHPVYLLYWSGATVHVSAGTMYVPVPGATILCMSGGAIYEFVSLQLLHVSAATYMCPHTDAQRRTSSYYMCPELLYKVQTLTPAVCVSACGGVTTTAGWRGVWGLLARRGEQRCGRT